MDGIDRRALTADETLSLEEQSHHTTQKVVHERRKAPDGFYYSITFLGVDKESQGDGLVGDS